MVKLDPEMFLIPGIVMALVALGYFYFKGKVTDTGAYRYFPIYLCSNHSSYRFVIA